MRIMLETWTGGRWAENEEFTGENAMGRARAVFVGKLHEGVAHRLIVIDMAHDGTSKSAEANLRDYHGPSHSASS